MNQQFEYRLLIHNYIYFLNNGSKNTNLNNKNECMSQYL